MGMIKEFKEFAMKGNVMDMAVGIIIGGAFGKIVSSLVEHIIMPIVGSVGIGDFSKLSHTFGSGENAAVLQYGLFIQTVLDFLIIAFCIFMMIKLMNKARTAIEDGLGIEEEEPAPEETPADIKLLQEIRDALKK